MKVAKLIFVEHGNNKNKYYDMTDDGSTLTCKYGRVGSSEQTATYPSRDWNKKYNEKIRKGYTDVTDLHKVVSSEAEYSAVCDSEIDTILNRLLGYSNSHIKQNYTVSSSSVTKQQIDRAQEIINSLSATVRRDISAESFNRELMMLFQVIPRRMGRVSDYIISPELDKSGIIESAKKIITAEQDTLDTMATKVSMNIPMATEDTRITLLDALGLQMRVTTPKEVKTIKESLGEISGMHKRSYHVIHKKSFDSFDEKIGNNSLLFHGSRNENFISILKTGLLIRPSSAVYSGSMFSDGIYFADKAKKSLGYTSVRGSRWANGSSETGYMAIFETALGNQKHIYKHTSDCYMITHQGLLKDGFNSVFAHGGADLINNEFIVYNSNQCRIKYLIELA